jgi:hypothetical protein
MNIVSKRVGVSRMIKTHAVPRPIVGRKVALLRRTDGRIQEVPVDMIFDDYGKEPDDDEPKNNKNDDDILLIGGTCLVLLSLAHNFMNLV